MQSRVINFHACSDAHWMRKTLTTISKYFNMVDVDAVYRHVQGEEPLYNACHITFDDGDRSFYEVIYPILQDLQIPASTYVSPYTIENDHNFWFQELEGKDPIELRRLLAQELNCQAGELADFPVSMWMKMLPLGQIWSVINQYNEIHGTTRRTKQNMTLDQLRQIHQEGLVTIGAHTMNHPILANEQDHDAQFEVVQSVHHLSTLLASPIQYFAYPNGIPEWDFGAREIAYLKSSGVKMAFAAIGGNLKPKHQLFAIPRYGFSYGNHAFILNKLLFGPQWRQLKILLGRAEINKRKAMKAQMERWATTQPIHSSICQQ